MRTQRNHIDIIMLFTVLALMVLSLGIVYSASSTYAQEKWGESGRLLNNHTTKVLFGFMAMTIFMAVDYRKLKKLTKPAIILLCGVLVITLVLGIAMKGASRWMFGLQPSEFAKFALLFHLSTLIAEKGEHVRDFKTGLLPMLFWIGSTTIMVLLQPNFSTGAMMFVLGLLMLYVGRANLKHLLLIVVSLVPLLAVYMLSAPYRMDRIMKYLGHGSQSTGGMNYQVWQGIIGFGNGGLTGLGPGLSRQRDLFLPESYGDFVFAIVGEEYGLLGTLLVLLAFAVIMVRGMKIARNARDEFGRTLAIGITSAVTLYAIVNAGVTLGLLPTTGLPMPFVSYGGSSMIATSAAIGVLLNISSQTDLYPRAVPPVASTTSPQGVYGGAT